MIKIPRSPWLLNLLVLVALILCEFIWYGPIIGKVGFYLDDWATYSNLANSHQDWLSLLQTSLSDPRIVTRPIEALVYVGSWLAFHDQPWGHHFFNCTLEVFSAFFLYLALCRLSKNHAFSFAASLLMLVYPSHDSTHYWVTANTINLSLGLYLISWWQSIKAVQDKKTICFLWSALAFLLSLLTYEAFLPLILINAITTVYLYKKDFGWKQSLTKSIIALSPFLISIGAIYYFQRVFLVQLHIGFHHPIEISVLRMFKVTKSGFLQTLFTPLIFACFSRIHDACEDLSLVKIALLVVLTAVIGLTLRMISGGEDQSIRPRIFAGLGLTIIIISYVIYGTSPDYMPNLESILNRINIAAATGASILICSGFWAILEHFKSSAIMRTNLLTAMLSPLLIFFILANWGWSIPWIISWRFQKHVIHLVQDQRGRLHNNDAIILAHTPRYVMWSPLFDGVWDFQAMLRMYLNAPKIQGGVVSDRMVVSKDSVKDISMGYLCASYAYEHLFVFVPNPQQWIPVHCANEFIEAIQVHGFDFGLTQDTIMRWRKELLSSTDSTKSL